MSNRGRHKKSNQHLIVKILGQSVANRMMQCQKEQGNIPNLDVFLRYPSEGQRGGGFIWHDTKEGHRYWNTLLCETLAEHPLYKIWKVEHGLQIIL